MFLSLERAQVKGRKMITVTHSLLILGKQHPTHTNTQRWWMKGPTPRVQTWFMALLWLLVLPTYVWVLTNPQLYLYFRNAPLLSTCVCTMQDGSHLWQFTGNKTYSTVWMSTTRKTQRVFNTLPPVSRGRWKKVQGGVFIPSHAMQTPRHRRKMPLIVLAYLCMRRDIKWSGKPTLCSLVFLNWHTSVLWRATKGDWEENKQPEIIKEMQGYNENDKRRTKWFKIDWEGQKWKQKAHAWRPVCNIKVNPF